VDKNVIRACFHFDEAESSGAIKPFDCPRFSVCHFRFPLLLIWSGRGLR
jgi:hypothetical protein